MENRESPSSFPSLPQGWLEGERGWNQVDYSVKFLLFTLSGLKVKVGGFRVKFVSDLMDVID